VPYKEKEIPVIGSFGFATKGKGFQHVVEAVNLTLRIFDKSGNAQSTQSQLTSQLSSLS